MRRLLFVLPAFRYGGTMTSFSNLLILLSNEDYEIDVYAIVDEGEGRDQIAKTVRILNSVRMLLNSKSDRRFSFRHIAKRVKDALAKAGIDIGPWLIKKKAQSFNAQKYDAVIAYQEGYPTVFVANLKAKYKIAWIHSMYSRWGNDKVSREYDNMDRIVCVSETAKQDLLSSYRNRVDRIRVVKNALNVDVITRLSNETPIQKGDWFQIVSVGRIDPVKRFSMIPLIAKELRGRGLRFKWAIVGGVADKKEYETIVKRIGEDSLQDVVTLEGQMSNPYPAIRNSDLLVCLSSSETFNYTLAEARVLGVPVISSDFPSSKEFINDRLDGIICPIEKMAGIIYDLITNKDYYQKQKEAIRGYRYNNEVVMAGLRELMQNI